MPARSTADGDYDTVVTPESAGWGYSGLKVLALSPSGTATFATGDAETLVLPLSGSCTVDCDGEVFEVQGRRNVFSRVTDFVRKREFDILIDGQTLARQQLNLDHPGEFFDVEYPIPAALIAGKKTVRVRFAPLPRNTAGPVFGVRLFRNKPNQEK